jgi:hypothetical protein
MNPAKKWYLSGIFSTGKPSLFILAIIIDGTPYAIALEVDETTYAIAF